MTVSGSRSFSESGKTSKLLPTRPWKRCARNDNFSFKSATKMRSQMVYELNEKRETRRCSVYVLTEIDTHALNLPFGCSKSK